MSDASQEGDRVPNPDKVVLWEARRFVRPFQDKLEVWTAEAARLGAVRAGDRNSDYRGKVSLLLQLVIETRAEFQRMSEIQSSEVARHSLVRDIRRAFERLDQALR